MPSYYKCYCLCKRKMWFNPVFESITLSSIVGLMMDSINKITFKKGQNSSYMGFILKQ